MYRLSAYRGSARDYRGSLTRSGASVSGSSHAEASRRSVLDHLLGVAPTGRHGLIGRRLSSCTSVMPEKLLKRRPTEKLRNWLGPPHGPEVAACGTFLS